MVANSVPVQVIHDPFNGVGTRFIASNNSLRAFCSSYPPYSFLDIEQNGHVARSIPIRESSVIVGRLDPQRKIAPEIDLTPFDTLNTVSRQHARIRVEKNFFSIEDLRSRNKTRQNNAPLTPHKPELLQNGDVVRFGSVNVTFRLSGTSELPTPWSQS